uniref:uncharacterized protein LOC122591593 n=1 Tax=Erigeron canadensis TaxID=72917 RepID=UPI001CB948E0|nr:uncharacterized protein LOC122591593 [Erigeron canadensis]
MLSVPKESVKQVFNRYQYTLSGYFIGKRVAFPVVENFARNNWVKHGFIKIMMNVNGFFFCKFNSNEGMQKVLNEGPWLIRSVPIFLNKWTPNVMLKKEDITSVPVWVKMHKIPMAAYTDDGLSLLATKLGNPRQLDSYTNSMCLESWGRANYAGAQIEVSAKKELKESLKKGVTVDEDGFQEVRRKANQQQGFSFKKSKLVFEYRPVSKPKSDPPKASRSQIPTQNTYDLLNDYGEGCNEPLFKTMEEKDEGRKENVDLKYTDSDDDEVEMVLDETAKFMARGTTTLEGASTPVIWVSDG